MATKKTTTRTKKTSAKKASPKRATAKKAAAKKTPARTAKAKSAKTDRKLSALDAAAKVLGESKEPLNSKEMIEAMATKGYWKSPGGKTPHATLYAAIIREISAKGKDARFKKAERGKFILA